MFSNFVTFTEVIKLSQDTFYRCREINFSEDIAKLRKYQNNMKSFEIKIFEQTVDMFQDISTLISLMPFCYSHLGHLHYNMFKCLFNSVIMNRSKDEIQLFFDHFVNRNKDYGIFRYEFKDYIVYMIENGIIKSLTENNISLRSTASVLSEIAAYRGDLETIEYLEKENADINFAEVLKTGLVFNRLTFCFKLFEKYRITNIKDIENREIIKQIVGLNDLNLIILLEGSGFNIHKNKEYMLRYSCRLGRFEIVEYLIQKNAKVNTRDNSALKNAFKSGNIKIIESLINHGADSKFLEEYSLKWLQDHSNDIIKYYLRKNGIKL